MEKRKSKMGNKTVTFQITKEVYECVESLRGKGEFMPETLARILQYGVERLMDIEAFKSDDPENDDRILIF